ncbi:DUF1566 domain-containing protein [bacterium]|nr:DUF1566 domain-containing protein [bacterium]
MVRCKCKTAVDNISEQELASNFIDRGDYIELVRPIGTIRMIQKGMAQNAMNWHEAMDYAKNLNLGGFTDWHVPTIEELKAIYKIQKICGIDKSDDAWFWSSSPSKGDPESANFIGFFKGKNSNGSKNENCGCVRCCR